MKCPKCDVLLDYVIVTSDCWQRGYLKGDSNRVGDYNSPVVETTQSVTCPECCADITEFVELR